jgi:hypothetical protein
LIPFVPSAFTGTAVRLLAVAFAGGVAIAGGAEPSATAAPRAPHGYAIYPPGNRQYFPGDSLSAELLAHTPIEWILWRDRWKYMEPQKDAYDLSLMKRELARYFAAGKKVGILVMTGSECTPDWLPGDRHQGALVPWAKSIAVEFDELLAEIARLEVTPGVPLADDPRLVLVYPTGPTVPSHEMHLHGMERAPGFSSEKMYQAWARAIDSQHRHFPKVAGGLAISVQAPVRGHLDRVIAKLQQTKGKQLATFQHNGLSNKVGIRTGGYGAHQRLFQLHAQGWIVGAEMLTSAAVSPNWMETDNVMVAVRHLPVGTFFVGYAPDWRQFKEPMP